MTRHGADKFLLRYSLLSRNWGKIWFSVIYIHTGTLIPGLLFLLDRWNTKLFITCTINIMSHYHKWQFITKATQDLYTVLTHLVAAWCLDLSLSSHQSCLQLLLHTPSSTRSAGTPQLWTPCYLHTGTEGWLWAVRNCAQPSPSSTPGWPRSSSTCARTCREGWKPWPSACLNNFQSGVLARICQEFSERMGKQKKQ